MGTLKSRHFYSQFICSTLYDSPFKTRISTLPLFLIILPAILISKRAQASSIRRHSEFNIGSLVGSNGGFFEVGDCYYFQQGFKPALKSL